MKQIINKILSKLFGIRIVRNSAFNFYLEFHRKISQSNSYELGELLKLTKTKNFFFDTFSKSRSQILQDLFVLIIFDFKKNGFFVEFGATDGNNLSNTFILEKLFEWNGILVEPSKSFHENLSKNRGAIIDHRCVYINSGEDVLFHESEIGELSTINDYADHDEHKGDREKGINYTVETVSLLDLLDQYNAPRKIDYLSIDTEGSEFEILNSFDFNKYSFGVITVEHNFIEQKRQNIKLLLEKNGYLRIMENVSKWDDWYVKKEYLSR